jgi:hypothetical protein
MFGLKASDLHGGLRYDIKHEIWASYGKDWDPSILIVEFLI